MVLHYYRLSSYVIKLMLASPFDLPPNEDKALSVLLLTMGPHIDMGARMSYLMHLESAHVIVINF